MVFTKVPDADLLREGLRSLSFYLNNIIKFAVPIILLALSIKDFGGGIISQNDNALKVSLMKFGKRLIIIIFLTRVALIKSAL